MQNKFELNGSPSLIGIFKPGGKKLRASAKFQGVQGSPSDFRGITKGNNSGILGVPEGGWVQEVKMPKHRGIWDVFHGLSTLPPCS